MRATAPFEADPHAVICELVAAAEPGLSPETVQEAIQRAVASKPAAVRLAQALEGGLLTSGRAEGPASVERFIRILQELGAVNVVRPPCSRCGKLRPLTNTNGAGLRLCASCGSSNKTKGWACAVCGNNATPRYGLDRTGREACRSCFKAECTEDPASDLLQFLVGRPLGVSEDTLRAVIAEVTEGKLTISRRLHWDVQNDPALLTGQADHYSPRTVLLVDRLHHAGATGVSAPKCPHCQRTVRLGHSIKRLRVCGSCYNRSLAEPCKWCSRSRTPAGRDASGAPFCNTCRDKEATCQETCIVCGKYRAVSARTDQGPICSACRKPPTMTCTSCGNVRPCFHSTTDSPRCRACLTTPEPCTDCGRTKRVVARVARGPFCENCWEVAPEARKPCEDCGKVERLFHFGRCRRCAGERHLRRLLTPPDGRPRPELDQIAAALLDHNPRRALLYTRESKEAASLLNDLASGVCELSHEALDARSAGHRRDLAVDWFRSVLVAAGILPVRDEYLARLERWIEYKTAALDDPEHRQLITAYARWDRVARIRRRARGKTITASTADITQVQISKAVLFLAWLKNQGERLPTCRQEHIDLWLTSEPHQGPYAAGPFVAWAVRSKFASEINIPTRAHRVSYRPLDADERWKIARQLLNDDSFETKDRVAGLMVLLYGQTPARTCRLTTDHVLHDEDGVALRINKTPLRLPPPLDALVLQLVDIAHSHEHAVNSNETNAPWLFPTQRPGRALTSSRLATRLRNIGLPSEAGRCAALLDLCTQMPPAVLQRLLGISPMAAERWSAGAVRMAYAAEVARRS